MTEILNDLAAKAGLKWFHYQREVFEQWDRKRACLFYKTGAGKSVTSLTMLAAEGVTESLVIAPPSTHPAWQAWGQKLGVDVDCISHAKFRQKDYKLSRHKAVIADEFHMFGGHGGKGWKKLDGLARSLQAPLILASATPNYNDAERVYCIQHVLDPHSVKGGYLAFLYAHCNTEQNPFGMEPLVDKDQPFRNFKDAAEYLAALPQVFYLPDDLVYTIEDIEVPTHVDPVFFDYGYNRFGHRMVASQMEERHTLVNLRLIDDNGYLNDEVYYLLTDLVGQATTPTLIFTAHATVASALAENLRWNKVRHGLVDGSLTSKAKAKEIEAFIAGKYDVLVGTASLATGTDGLDKMCDTLIILDDTDDDALRRQLIGRIMPRGSDTDASKKQVYRIVLT